MKKLWNEILFCPKFFLHFILVLIPEVVNACLRSSSLVYARIGIRFNLILFVGLEK